MRSFTSIQPGEPHEVPIRPRPGAEDTAEARRIRELVEAADWASRYHAYDSEEEAGAFFAFEEWVHEPRL